MAALQHCGSVALALLWISVSGLCWSYQGAAISAKDASKAPL